MYINCAADREQVDSRQTSHLSADMYLVFVHNIHAPAVHLPRYHTQREIKYTVQYWLTHKKHLCKNLSLRFLKN